MTAAQYRNLIEAPSRKTSKDGTERKRRCLPFEGDSAKAAKKELFEVAKLHPSILSFTQTPQYNLQYKYLSGEDLIQIAFVAWVNRHFPTVQIIHIKNEGKADKMERAKDVMMGFKKGASDLLLQKENGRNFFIELKTLDGKPSKEQIEFIEKQAAFGNNAAILYGIKNCLKAFLDWYNDK
jgi:VRR-NUC domain